ncbi:MAG: hypothetical protein KAS30_02170, partial [Candidatus Diapherotrites archaeon]|nr:hypothetical protein [Candidatus Diapherotrites archaeon]
HYCNKQWHCDGDHTDSYDGNHEPAITTNTDDLITSAGDNKMDMDYGVVGNAQLSAFHNHYDPELYTCTCKNDCSCNAYHSSHASHSSHSSHSSHGSHSNVPTS